MSTIRVLAVLAAVLAAPLAAAQSLPVQVRMSTGTFLYDEAQSLVEVYLSVGAASLAYAAADGGFAADLAVDISLRPAASGAAPGEASETVVASDRFERRYVVADTSVLTAGQVFVEQVRLAVSPGEYEVVAAISGGGARPFRAFEARADVAVPAYAEGASPRLSSLQLASEVTRSTDDSDPYFKNGLRLVPNPDAFYGEGRPTVVAYAEIYRPPGDGRYTLLTYLTEGGGTVALPGTESRLERAVRPVDPVVLQQDISTLPTGLYNLRAVVLNAGNEAVAESASRFFVINPNVERPEVAAPEMTAEEAVYAVMGEEELIANLEHARVIATSRERSDLDPLLREGATDEARRAFLVRFWAQRDTDPSPSVNAARRTFYERLAQVETRYRRGSQPGYRTDQGRVYLQYGAPSQVDRRNNDEGKLPHEIWEYEHIEGEGQAVFIFADRFSAGRMELVHSTVTGEVTLPNWQQAIIIR